MTRKEMEAIEAAEQEQVRHERIAESMAYNASKRRLVGTVVEFDAAYLSTPVGRICQDAVR